MSNGRAGKAIIGGALIAGLAYLLYKLLTQSSVRYYRCENCNRIVREDNASCPYCGIMFEQGG